MHFQLNWLRFATLLKGNLVSFFTFSIRGPSEHRRNMFLLHLLNCITKIIAPSQRSLQDMCAYTQKLRSLARHGRLWDPLATKHKQMSRRRRPHKASKEKSVHAHTFRLEMLGLDLAQIPYVVLRFRIRFSTCYDYYSRCSQNAGTRLRTKSSPLIRVCVQSGRR